MSQESQVLTYGQKAVGITFNPGKLGNVDNIKASSAAAIDIINDLRVVSSDGETIAQYTLAIRSIMQGQMWAVKACTWNLPPRA